MSNNKYFSKSRYPLDLTKKLPKDLGYEEGYQYGGNILPYNTFSEYDKMYPEGGQVKPTPNPQPKPEQNPPIYTTDPNDPRLRMYNDSLVLYNTQEKLGGASSNWLKSVKKTPKGMVSEKDWENYSNRAITKEQLDRQWTSFNRLTKINGVEPGKKTYFKQELSILPEGFTTYVSDFEKPNQPIILNSIPPKPIEKYIELEKKGLSPIPTNSPISNIQLKPGTPVQERPKGNFLITTQDKPLRFQRKEDYDEVLEILKAQGLTPKSKSELANGQEASANFAGTFETIMKWMDGTYQGTPAYKRGGRIKPKVEEPLLGTPLEPIDIVGKKTRVTGIIDEYNKLDPIRQQQIADKQRNMFWRRGDETIENDPENQKYNFVAKKLLDTLPKGLGERKQLAKYDSLTPRERQIINESMYANKFKKPEAWNANREMGKMNQADPSATSIFKDGNARKKAELYDKGAIAPFLPTLLNPIDPLMSMGANMTGAATEGNYGEAVLNAAGIAGLGYVGGGVADNLLPLGGLEKNAIRSLTGVEKYEFSKLVNDNIQKYGSNIVNSLKTSEGQLRLRNQFIEANPYLTDKQLDYLVKTRIQEVDDAITYNKGKAYKMLMEDGQIEANNEAAFESFFPKDNAHFDVFPVFGGLSKSAPKDLFPEVTQQSNIFGINLNKQSPTEQFLNPNKSPGSITLGQNLQNNIKVLDHEIGHGIQKNGKLPIDYEIQDMLNLTKSPKYRTWFNILQKINPQSVNDYMYLKLGSKGKEGYAFLREQRRKMLESGVIKDIYEEITPTKLAKTRLNAMFNKQPNFIEGDRLIKMTPPWKYNELSKIMNKSPAIVPPAAIGVGLLNQQAKAEKTPQFGDGGYTDTTLTPPIHPLLKDGMINKNDTRADGSLKGNGWLGPIEMKGRAKGLTMTEKTVGFDGQDIPSIVPTLNRREINYISRDKYNPSNRKGIDERINIKALDHADLMRSQNHGPYVEQVGPSNPTPFKNGGNIKPYAKTKKEQKIKTQVEQLEYPSFKDKIEKLIKQLDKQ